MSTTKCPHCGKVLASEDKLAFHLTKECPELRALTSKEATQAQSASKAVHSPRH